MKWRNEDTIAAVATPPGVGGVAIVRVSGPRAVALTDPLFHPTGQTGLARAPSHRLLHGWVVDAGRRLDEVLAVVMRAPRSYTREDVVELHCHGGHAAVRAVLDLVLAGGGRMAAPGEFTWRAFMNGRLDLTQAEAVADLVVSGTPTALAVNAAQLGGRLQQEIGALKEQLLRGAALVAAAIDFPEEQDWTEHQGELARLLDQTAGRLEELVGGADQGRILAEGLRVAILGRPNVGKSSLLNALLGEDRAIVTDVPGTTRDTLEELARVGGVMTRLIDTAGIRASQDLVEQMGIARARRAMASADLVLLVLDGSAPLEPDDRELLAQVPPGTLLVVNKQDRMTDEDPPWAGEVEGFSRLGLSAKTGQGLEGLRQAVHQRAVGNKPLALEHPMLTNLRQKQAARDAWQAVDGARQGLAEGRPGELLAVDLDRALAALGAVTGDTTPEDLLEEIFSRFCIGK
ncbi:MAG: tRNA uridine-5-carboxymethylaminomethyl(34) synthesis GTPase MnmE [Deltaproteobacteria bacterium]|nr:tRNA uridine-5-carboxymethylaminomethyl(34) synthesis GTPase MnmE [Deltaproteobacteria bacterium]